MSAHEDDGFGRHWDYRVFSEVWTCPDDWNRGQRYLTVHRVDYIGGLMGSLEGTHEHPIPPHDLIFIEHVGATPDGIGMEEIMLDHERIGKAYDLPVLIKAEWQGHFDHSRRCDAENDKRHRQYQREAREREKAAKEAKAARATKTVNVTL